METKKVLVGLFDDDHEFLHAIKVLRSEGVRIDDAIMPFPVHGFEEALGMKESRLHVGGFWMGLLGCVFIVSFITLISVDIIPGFSWPNNWGGKPNFSLLSWIPITFEVTVLSASVSMFIAFVIRNTLFPGKKPIVIDERLTSHLFAITFDPARTGDASYDEVKELLTANGAIEIKEAVTEKSRLLNIR